MVTPLCYSCEIISRAAAASRGRFERVKAFQHPHHLRRRPLAVTARSRNGLLIQARCNSPQRGCACFLQRLDRGGEIGRPTFGALLGGAHSGGAGSIRTVGDLAIDRLALVVLADDLAATTAELHAALLSGGERILGALADHAAFLF